MKESLFNAHQEFKRADHLLYVSLKYTRTADVIKNVVERLINTYNFVIEALLIKAQDDREIDEIPKTPKEKVEALKKVYSNRETFLNHTEFYFLLRRILRAPYSARSEFRRHVTMISDLDEVKIEITIDIISEYYNRTSDFLEYVEGQILGQE